MAASWPSGSGSGSGSGRTARLAQQLRLFDRPLSADKLTLSFDSSAAAVGPTTDGKLVISQGCITNNPKRSAVLICVFEGNNGDLRVILTKRSSKLSSHSGEVALPGGKAEEGDADDAETALREANEEIGLHPSLVDVVRVLDPFTTKYGMMVVPVVGLLVEKSSFQPTLNPDEVDEIFDVPLEMFLKDGNRRQEEKEWEGEKYLLHFFDYEADNGKAYVIYALSAGILICAASVVYLKSPPFPLRKPSFWTPSSSN